jgi:hypothetical protein
MTAKQVKSEPLIGHDLPAMWVALACAVIYAALHALALGWPEFYSEVIAGHTFENLGALELMCAAVLAIGILAAVRLFMTARRAKAPGLWQWALLIIVGLTLLLGEEINWGQIFFAWETSGVFARYNDEGETNFHNMTSWLDQKPRALLNAAIFLGGIVHPLMQRLTGKGLLDRPWWLAPSFAALPAAVFVTIAGLPKLLGLDHAFAHILPTAYRVSEVEELFIYVFFLVYLLSLQSRLSGVRSPHRSATQPP